MNQNRSVAPSHRELKRLERRQIPVLPGTDRGLRSLPAWAFSLIFHVTLITALGILWVGQPKGTGAQRERPVGVAVVYESAGQEEYFLGDSGGASKAAAENSAEDSLPTSDSVSSNWLSTESILSDLLPGAATAGGDSSAAAGGLGLGDGGASLGGNRAIPKVKTSVFGIEGEGTRFLYVFDRSDSMNGYEGRPLKAAKSELLQSLDSLGPAHEFQIIFYNDTPLPFGGLSGRGPSLLNGEDRSKENARRFVRDIVAVGGTRHIDALRMAIGMSPDVVFFLTDADIAPTSRDIEDLHVRAHRVGATIHSIQFGTGPNQSGGVWSNGGWIRHLAEGTNGQYRYIDVTELPAPTP